MEIRPLLTSPPPPWKHPCFSGQRSYTFFLGSSTKPLCSTEDAGTTEIISLLGELSQRREGQDVGTRQPVLSGFGR